MTNGNPQSSLVFESLIKRIMEAASSPDNLYIIGEIGTGKRHAAVSVHRASGIDGSILDYSEVASAGTLTVLSSGVEDAETATLTLGGTTYTGIEVSAVMGSL